ncbi:hypothetical protein H0H87_003316 [Tephrocybe sp. NHM501043]|nr:hypothetical protein H0H87_003316 [Tephrocybe sp. NHM501043]
MATDFDVAKFVTLPNKNHKDGELTQREVFWRKHCQFLKDQGYTLRSRYQPDWKPSWLGTSKDWMDCEDGIVCTRLLLDAVRADGTLVMLKAVNPIDEPDEISVGNSLSSKRLASPRNHCVPYLDILGPPEGSDEVFIVLPLLVYIDRAPFETIGEVMEFFRQIFEGLEFMHENDIAHEDCKFDNMMAEAQHLFDAPIHPFKVNMRRDFASRASIITSRTLKPVKYYLIDFGLSKEYPPGGPPRLEEPPWGGDKTVPEHWLPDAPPTLTASQGDEIRKPKQGFEFMRKLVDDMTNADPQKRPKMNEVVPRLNAIIKGLSDWHLRSPVLELGKQLTFKQRFRHRTKQLIRMARGIPAIPRP